MALIYRDHDGVPVRSVAWSPDGTRVATASSGRTPAQPAGSVHTWEVATGATRLRYQGHPIGAAEVAWSPDGALLASAGGWDGTAQVWDAHSGETLVIYRGARRTPSASGLQPDAPVRVSAPSPWLQGVGWLAGGQRIASTFDNEVHIWEATTGHFLFAYRQHKLQIAVLAVAADGSRAASVTGWLVQVWETVTKARQLLIYRGHTGDLASVVSLAWSPDGSYLASGTSNGTVQVWDSTTGASLLTYRGHNRDESLITNPANLPKGEPLTELRLLRQYLSQYLGDPRIVTEPDAANAIVQEHIERDMRAANAAKRGEQPTQPAAPKRVNTWAVSALAWSPNGTRIASGSYDKTVRVWEAGTGDHLFTYQEHSAAVTAVAWSPDGTRIASADAAGLVHIWPVE